MDKKGIGEAKLGRYYVTTPNFKWFTSHFSPFIDKENVQKTEAALAKLKKKVKLLKQKVGRVSESSEEDKSSPESKDEDMSFDDFHFSSTVHYSLVQTLSQSLTLE